MSKKAKKNVIITVIALLLVAILSIGSGYLVVYLFELPVSLPFLSYALDVPEFASDTASIISTWANYETYEPKTKYKTVEEILSEESFEIDEISVDELVAMFPLIDEDSLIEWITNNPESVMDGYERLLIDEVDYDNTPTGIKTIYGDDVLAVDAADGLMIVGIDITVNGESVSKVKLAIVNDKSQLDMTMVDDLKYWKTIDEHAYNSGAILAINASGYNWSSVGNCASLYGVAKWHGTTYRKATSANNTICFSTDMTMSIGTDAEYAYNAVEMTPFLLKNGQIICEEDEDLAGDNESGYVNQSRYARTAVGQATDGTSYLLVASGSFYGSGLGATAGEIANILQEYGAITAASLSSGSRSVMYWNGRVVNETVGYDQTGLKLPNTICVMPKVYVED